MCLLSFLGSIKAPVPSSRPAIIPAASRWPCQIRRLRRDRSHAQPRLRASMARTHDLARPGRGATVRAGCRGATLSHAHIRGAAEPRRWRPDRARSCPEVRPPWRCRADFRARLRTRRHIRPGPRSSRPARRSSASTGFAAPPRRAGRKPEAATSCRGGCGTRFLARLACASAYDPQFPTATKAPHDPWPPHSTGMNSV